METLKPLLGRTGPKNRRICMLIITHSCNLNCSYCYEVHKDARTMSFEMAKSIILKEVDLVKRSTEFKEIEVDFMGGEPFMNFGLIQQIVEWMEHANLGIPFITACATNGTLVTAEKKPWLNAHKKTFVPGLSYDGDEKMQALNRTLSAIDIDYFISTWPEQDIHITVSKETLPTLSAGVLNLQRKGALVNAALAQGIEWNENDVKTYERELRRLAEAYLDDPELNPIQLLSRPLFSIGKCDSVARKYCGTGKGMVTYDVDGECYPCHLFSPLVLGDRALPLSKSDVCCDAAISDKYCQHCAYVNWCPTCYGFNYRLRGETCRRDHSWCGMIDIQARVSCEFQLNYYFKHRSRLSKDMDGEQIGAALDAYRILNLRRISWRRMDMDKDESFEHEYAGMLKKCVASGDSGQMLEWLKEMAKDESLLCMVIDKLTMLSKNEQGWPGANDLLKSLSDV